MPYSAGYAIADIAALKALPLAELVNGYTRLVLSNPMTIPTWYTWNSTSTATDDGNYVVSLTGNPTGRFIKTGANDNSIRSREILTSSRTYFVSTTGNDSNTGLSAASSFLTIQKAIDVVTGNLDLGVFTVAIQIADGNYNVGSGIRLKSALGSGSISINGTSSNTFISSTTAGNATILYDQVGTSYSISNITIRNSGTVNQINGIGCYNFAQLVVASNVTFGGGFNNHFVLNNNASIFVSANYNVNGSAGDSHINASVGSGFLCQGRTIVFNGNPSFTRCVLAQTNSMVLLDGNTYFGNPTGSKYLVTTNSVCTGGNALPHPTAGASSTGAQVT